LGIDTVVSFDVPPGSTPEAVVLHDSAFSGGTKVNLSGLFNNHRSLVAEGPNAYGDIRVVLI
jgi:hypothetical protein